MSATPPPAVAPSSARSGLNAQFGTYIGLAVVLLGMIALFGSMSEYFLTRDTFISIANEIPALAVMAVGMTFVLIIAGIDLSVGSVLALSAAVTAAAILEWKLSVPLAALLGLATGLICGTVTGAGVFSIAAG